MDFLRDRTFLLKVARHKVKTYYAAVMCLDFETEKPLARLEGKVVSGNVNVAANSPVRRTAALSLVFDDQTYNIVDINNLISIDKKISLSIGMKNPYYYTQEYKKYGEVLWFKQGVFIITAASSSVSTSSLAVSVTLQDKMCLLNGTCGGTLPASTSFHDRIIIEGEGDDQTITTEYPIIKDIIRECVHHFGGEHFSRISIEDVPEVGRIVMEYIGSSPIHFATRDTDNGGYERLGTGSFIVSGNLTAAQKRHYKDTYVKGDNVGYKETPLTFPGELIQKGGSTVTNVLDEIVKALGNYQYYYDVDGIFHFKYKTNFLATGNTPLNLNEQENNVLSQYYTPRYSPSILLNEFVDAELVTNIAFSPNYSNIKNDFVYWGSRQADNKTEVLVRYHLAIDKKPEDIPLPETEAEAKVIGDNFSLCHKSISEVWSADKKHLIRYQLSSIPVNEGEVFGKEIAPSLNTVFPNHPEYWFNWREELYRRALMAYGSSTDGSYYDEELMAEWRNLYDPTSTIELEGPDSFEQKWEDKYGAGGDAPVWQGYRVEVYTNPEKIRYWLDFIDTTSELGKYSVSRIGRRTVVTEDSKVNEVYAREINDIVFIEAPVDEKEWEKTMDRVKREYIPIGQTYAFVQGEQWAYFKEKNSYGTCFEGVRSQLYEHIYYNSSVNLTTIPLLYLDGNQMIHLNFPNKGVTGDFVINTIGFNLTGQTMTLGLQEAMVVV